MTLPPLSAETLYQDREEDNEHVVVETCSTQLPIMTPTMKLTTVKQYPAPPKPSHANKQKGIEKWLLVVESPVMFAAFPSEDVQIITCQVLHNISYHAPVSTA